MSIWGEQWLCGCGWANVFVRKKCRHCGAPKREDAPTQSPEEVMTNVQLANTLARERKTFTGAKMTREKIESLAVRNIKALTHLRRVLAMTDAAAAQAINECDETRPVVDWRKIRPKLSEAIYVVDRAQQGNPEKRSV